METTVPARLTAAQGRRFGFTVGAAFGVLGGIAFWRGHSIPSIVAWTLGGLLILGALFVPSQLGPVERGWMKLAHAISKVTTPIFMAVVYFIILTPVGILMRLTGHGPLKAKSENGSHWVTRPESDRRSNLERQF